VPPAEAVGQLLGQLPTVMPSGSDTQLPSEIGTEDVGSGSDEDGIGSDGNDGRLGPGDEEGPEPPERPRPGRMLGAELPVPPGCVPPPEPCRDPGPCEPCLPGPDPCRCWVLPVPRHGFMPN
jgi:hypothetical protein